MRSFSDVQGNIIPILDVNDLELELQTDIVTGETTAYLVRYGDCIYEVGEKTYNALDKLIADSMMGHRGPRRKQ